MRRFTATYAAVAALAGPALLGAPANAQAIDLSDETVTIVHNASPGGSTGLSSQVLADAWAETMEGDPTIVVQSEPGGALTQGINRVLDARPDGLTLGYLAWQGSTRILDPEELQIPFEDFGVIGGIGGATFFVTATSEAVPSPEALPETESLRFGGFSARSAPSMQLAAALDLLGVDWSFVSGMSGDGPLRAALERGEIEAYTATAPIWLSDLRDGPIAAGDTQQFFHFGTADDDGNMVAADAFMDEIPTFQEYYTDLMGEEPSGEAWDMMMFHSRVSVPVNWIIVAPPGTPDEHVQMLRESFREAVESDAYKEAANRVFGSPPNIVHYEAMEKIVEDVQTTPQEMRDLLRRYIDEMSG